MSLKQNNLKPRYKPIQVKVDGVLRKGLVWNQNFGAFRLWSFDLGLTWGYDAKEAWNKANGGINEQRILTATKAVS